MKIRNRFDPEPGVPAFEELKRRIEAVSTDEMLARSDNHDVRNFARGAR